MVQSTTRTKKLLAKLKYEPERKDALPLDGVDSRNCSAIMFRHFGRRKPVIKLCLVLSKNARAFIISQNGLEGLIDMAHNNVHSWFYELIMSEEFKKDRLGFLQKAEFERMADQMATLKTTEEKEELLSTSYFGTYYTLLGDTGRESEIPELEDCSYEDYTKYCIKFQVDTYSML